MKFKTFLVIILILSGMARLGAQSADPASDDWSRSFGISTNLAYCLVSAFMSSGSSSFIVLPLEAEIGLSPSFALRPEIGVLINIARELAAPDLTYVANCALAWYPQNRQPRGWYLAAAPGAGYAPLAGNWIFILSAEGGYQWILGKGLLLGAGAGGRFVMMMDGSGGFLPLPDLRLRLGWVF